MTLSVASQGARTRGNADTQDTLGLAVLGTLSERGIYGLEISSAACESFRFAGAPYHLAPAPRLPKQLRVRPHAMEGHRAPTDSIDEHEVSSEVAFREATPVLATLSESMLAEGRWEPFAGDQGVEYIFERLRVELYVLTGVSVIALEAREND